MMISFSKYQGTGNDFVMIDNRENVFPINDIQLVSNLCNRRFGIGADGLILLDVTREGVLRMTYFNSDGRIGSMCGNGGRCFAAFARQLGFEGVELKFIAADGIHEAVFTSSYPVIVKLKMQEVTAIDQNQGYSFLNTGSPHYVKFVFDVNKVDVLKEGREVRYSDRFKKEGTNVNFVEIDGDDLKVRTYERGVEEETFSCGTGVTASVLAAVSADKINGETLVKVETLGGKLSVHFTKGKSGFENVWLEGPATHVFDGSFELDGV